MTEEDAIFWGEEPELKNEVKKGGSNTLYLGDNIKSLKGLDANSIDSIVTDPPY